MDNISEVDKWIQKNSDEILQTLSELIQIKTENLPPGGNEKPGQEYLYNKIIGFIPEKDIDIFEIDDIDGIREHPLFFSKIDDLERDYGNRPNLIAGLKGNSGRRSLSFTGHMDVMPAYGEVWKVFEDPFSGKVKEGKMYGRGSMDMKAGTLAGFYALKCIRELGIKLDGDVYAESLIDEENGGVNGTLAARLRYPNIDFAILTEPSALIAGIETVGGSDWKATVDVGGPGGFGFGEELSNPVYRLSKIAIALEEYDNKLKKVQAPDSFKKEQFIRLLTFQIYSGGSNYMESGAVPTRGHLYFWVETFAGVSEEKYRKDFLDFMRSNLEKYDDFRDGFPEFETVIRYLGGHRTDVDHPAMTSIRNSYRTLGLSYKQSGLGIASDAFAFRETGKTDVVVLGPEGGNAHGIDEWVDIKSIFNVLKILVLTAIDYCGKC
jgi:acetylornithine deacetylase